MGKITVGAFISLDGVMQAPGGPAEDPTQGFKFGGWVTPFFDAEFGEEVANMFADKPDLLLGRKTYEIFAAHWPYAEGGDDDAIAKLFKEITKYPVSRSGEVDVSWEKTVLLRDIEAVRRLRQQEGTNLITQGSSELVHALLAEDLVDEIKTFTVPVVLGGGKKLFAEGAAPRSYKLAHVRASSKGLVIARYERSGAIAVGDTALAQTSEAETARQARMRREN